MNVCSVWPESASTRSATHSLTTCSIKNCKKSWQECMTLPETSPIGVPQSKHHRGAIHSLVLIIYVQQTSRTPRELILHTWFLCSATWSVFPGKVPREYTSREGKLLEYQVSCLFIISHHSVTDGIFNQPRNCCYARSTNTMPRSRFITYYVLWESWHGPSIGHNCYVLSLSFPNQIMSDI